jgi:hypothetical protein
VGLLGNTKAIYVTYLKFLTARDPIYVVPPFTVTKVHISFALAVVVAGGNIAPDH